MAPAFGQCCRSSREEADDREHTEKTHQLVFDEKEAPGIKSLASGAGIDSTQSTAPSSNAFLFKSNSKLGASSAVRSRLAQVPEEGGDEAADRRYDAVREFIVTLYGCINNTNLDLLEADVRRIRFKELSRSNSTLPKSGTLGATSTLEQLTSAVRSMLGFTPDQSTAPLSRVETLQKFDTIQEEGGEEPKEEEKKPAHRDTLAKDLGTRLAALEESVPSKALQIDINNPGDLSASYLMKKKLGEGSFGTVHLAILKATGAMRAVKTIAKDRIKGQNKLLKKEIEVCKMVDHPNIVKLYEIFEDDASTHLILELCTGGELKSRIRTDVGMTEDRSTVVMRQIFRAVRYLHEQCICHRDLKAENIMVVGDERDPDLSNRLRVTDFGLSCTFKKDQVLKVACGSATHMAPEVFQKRYNHLADIWSVGVIMYEVCGGTLPFKGKDRDAVIAKVTAAKLVWSGGWFNCSTEAVNLLQGLLKLDPQKRIHLEDALRHQWLTKKHPSEKFVPLTDAVVSNLRGFRGLNKFKKAALSVIASLMNDSSIERAKLAFLELDRDGNGAVSLTELRDFLERVKPADVNMEECDQVAMAIFFENPNHDDDIENLKKLHKRASYLTDKVTPEFSYTEFLAATIDRTKISKDVCRVAFQAFDKNGDGTISKEELMFGRLLGKMGPEERDRLVEDLDIDGDGEINFDEFVEMMQDQAGWMKAFRSARGETFVSDAMLSRVLSINDLG